MDPNSQPEHKVKAATRRDFLITSTAGTAGALLAGETAAQRKPAASAVVRHVDGFDDLNVAFIGLGDQGNELMQCVFRIPQIRITAICDIWDYRRKRAIGNAKVWGHNPAGYVDYAEMLATEKDLDAVIIATPDFVHAEHAIACMNAGLHVYCEKEMSNKLEPARQMALESRRTGKLLQIGHQRRSNPRYIHAIDKAVRETKLLGRITHAYAQWNRAKSDDILANPKIAIPPDLLEQYGYDSMSHFLNWRWYRKYGGGPIVDLGSHQIDIFTWVFGSPPLSVVATGGIDFYKHHEWYDNVVCVFEYKTPDGLARALYQVLTTTSNGGYYESVMGEYGTLVIAELPERADHFLREQNVAPDWEPYAKEGLILKPPQEGEAEEKSKDVFEDVRVSPPPESWPLPIRLYKRPHLPHLENFFDAIRFGTPLTCPAEIGYETAVAVHKVNDAVRTMTKLYFTPDEFIA